MKTSLGGNILAYLDLGANLNPGLDAALLHMDMVGVQMQIEVQLCK